MSCTGHGQLKRKYSESGRDNIFRVNLFPSNSFTQKSVKNPKNHSNPAQPSSTADSGRLSSAGKRGKGYQELYDGEEVCIQNNMKVVICKTWSVSKSLVAPEGTVRQRLLKV